jgi:integrase
LSRSYKGIRPKKNRIYSVDDVKDLYKVCRNTVSNWVSAGLIPLDGAGQQLFRGAELARFHADRLARFKLDLRHGEFNCRSCKSAVFPVTSTVSIRSKKRGTFMAFGSCLDCGASVTKILGKTECDAIQNCINTNTSLHQMDELFGTKQGGIGINQEKHDQDWHSANDRIIFEWQSFAEKFDPKTVDSYLVAIREFEQVTDGKSLVSIKKEDAAAYRRILTKRLQMPASDGGVSKSTARHRVSHLVNFFDWLCKQDGYRRLNKSLSEYFELSKRATAEAQPRLKRLFPTMDEAIMMAENMPIRSYLDRRNRAIVAFAFVTGFRAAALGALRLKHIDITNKLATQDASEVPAKNGDSYVANWFPRTEPLQEIALSWINELQSLGLGPGDALFPPVSALDGLTAKRRQRLSQIEPMKTSLAVTEAFRVASETCDLNYMPHSNRHCLAALGDLLCRTSDQTKAWSKNLGHSSVKITKTHYGMLTETLKREVFENFSTNDLLTDDEKDLMLDYHDHRIHREDPQYERARTLVAKRAQVI